MENGGKGTAGWEDGIDKGREDAWCEAGWGMMGHMSIREVALLSRPQGGRSWRWAVCHHGERPVSARSPVAVCPWMKRVPSLDSLHKVKAWAQGSQRSLLPAHSLESVILTAQGGGPQGPCLSFGMKGTVTGWGLVCSSGLGG